MKRRNSKILTELFLSEKVSSFERDGAGSFPSYNNDNFEIRRMLFFNTLIAHEKNPRYSISSFDRSKYINEKFVTIFFPKIWMLLFLIGITAFVVMLKHAPIKPPNTYYVLMAMKYGAMVWIPIYIIMFLITIKKNLKYIRIIRHYKNKTNTMKNESDDLYVENMIKKNLTLYRKMKLDRLKNK